MSARYAKLFDDHGSKEVYKYRNDFSLQDASMVLLMSFKVSRYFSSAEDIGVDPSYIHPYVSKVLRRKIWSGVIGKLSSYKSLIRSKMSTDRLMMTVTLQASIVSLHCLDIIVGPCEFFVLRACLESHLGIGFGCNWV